MADPYMALGPIPQRAASLIATKTAKVGATAAKRSLIEQGKASGLAGTSSGVGLPPAYGGGFGPSTFPPGVYPPGTPGMLPITTTPPGGVGVPGGGAVTPIGSTVQQQVCGELPPILKQICETGAGYVERRLVGGGGNGNGATAERCPAGTVRVGNTCVSPGDLFPGGAPGTFGAGATAVQGAFGLPALTPVQEARVHRTCPAGMVLGRDNLCYPTAVLPRRSKYRKWRASKRPPISARDWKALQTAERVRHKVKDIAGVAGFTTSKRGGGRRRK